MSKRSQQDKKNREKKDVRPTANPQEQDPSVTKKIVIPNGI